MRIVTGKEQQYQERFDKNADPYGRRCFTYAQDWAELLEKQMAEQPELDAKQIIEKYAEPFSQLADIDGITGFMYGMAVGILAEHWIHGELLRRWHNLQTQIGNEGERANQTGGTLNPALLNLGKRK
jgi:hypothetical protein